MTTHPIAVRFSTCAVLLASSLCAVAAESDTKPAAEIPVDTTPAKPAAAADQAGQPTPRTPVVARAPARAEWTVHMSSETNKPEDGDGRATSAEAVKVLSSARTVESLQVSKDDQMKTYKLRTRWSDGKSEDEWIVMGQHVAERPGGRGLYIVAGESSTAQDLRQSDFPELNWVTMTNYRGIKTYKGKKVFMFVVPFDQKRLSGSDAQLFALAKQADKNMTPSKFFKAKSPDVVVYLDCATQLPLFYNDGSVSRRYAFSTPGEDRLRPSVEVVKFLRARAEALRYHLATPPGP